MAKKITIKIKNAKVQKRRSPHKPTKTQKSEKIYDRKKERGEIKKLGN